MSEEFLSGPDALKKLQPALNTIDNLPTKRIGLHAEIIAPALRQVFEQLSEDRSTILAPFVPSVRQKIERIFDEFPLLIRAFSHVSSQYERTPQAIKSRSTIAQEALELRPAVMRNLDLMQAIGLLNDEEANQTRAGRGFDDLGGDFRTMAPKIQAAWSILGPLQTQHKDPNTHLNEAKLKRVAQLGAQLGETDSEELDQTSEYVQLERTLRQLELLLERSWSYLRNIVPAAFTEANTPEKSEIVRYTLIGLQRSLQPPSPKPNTQTNPETNTPSL